MIASTALFALALCLQSESAVAAPDLGIELVHSISVGHLPAWVGFSKNGEHAYVHKSSREIQGEIATSTIRRIDCKTFETAGLGGVVGRVEAPNTSTVSFLDELEVSLNSTDGTVIIADKLNHEVAATVAVGELPISVSLTPEGTECIVVCAGSGSLSWINTASFEVVTKVTDGVGLLPQSVVECPGGMYGLVSNEASDSVSVLDYAARMIVDVIPVDEGPVAINIHPNGRHAYVTCKRAETVCVLTLPDPAAAPETEFRKNEVLILGTIHGGHTTSEVYDLKLLDGFIREVNPDYILAEIPPNRARAAMEGFVRDGAVSEPRVARFPEYLDVVYPLTRELDFEIIPTAGWTEPMARFRSKRLRTISEDPDRAAEWAEYEAASAAAEKCQEEAGASDDPYFINSALYDDCVEIDLSVYDRLFNDELGPGGWTAINESHYGHIADALDKHAGAGKRFLITYGAGHKGWFLRELRKRTDIELVEVAPFLMKAEAVLGRR